MPELAHAYDFYRVARQAPLNCQRYVKVHVASVDCTTTTTPPRNTYPASPEQTGEARSLTVLPLFLPCTRPFGSRSGAARQHLIKTSSHQLPLWRTIAASYAR